LTVLLFATCVAELQVNKTQEGKWRTRIAGLEKRQDCAKIRHADEFSRCPSCHFSILFGPSFSSKCIFRAPLCITDVADGAEFYAGYPAYADYFASHHHHHHHPHHPGPDPAAAMTYLPPTSGQQSAALLDQVAGM